ncbi:MAG: O-antigen ligase [Pseudomonadota bacterium]
MAISSLSVAQQNNTSGLLRAAEQVFAVFGLLLMLGALVGFFQDISATQGGTGSLTRGNLPFQVTSAFVYLVSAAFIATRVHQFFWLCSRNVALIALVGLAVLSVIWSNDPTLSLRRVVALVGTTLFAFYLVMRFRQEEVLKLLLVAFSIGAVTSYLIAFVAPRYGIHTSGTHIGFWHGVWEHKNIFGRIMTLGVIAFFIQFMASKHHRLALLVGMCLCFGLVVLSGSRTAWVTLALLLFAFWPLRALRQSDTSLALRMLMVLIVFVGGGLFLLATFYQEGLELIGRNDDLSSRTKIWGFAFEFGMAKPLLGHGYRAFWTVDNAGYVYRLLNWGGGIGHAHNGYIDIWLDLGFIGLGTFLVALFVAARNALRRLAETTDAFGYWHPLCLIFLVITGITERTFLQQGTIEWVLFVSLSLYLSIPLSRSNGPVGNRRLPVGSTNSYKPPSP